MQDLLIEEVPPSAITEKAASGDGHQPLTFSFGLCTPIRFMQISRHIGTVQSQHMAGNASLDPFPDFTVPGPGKSGMMEQYAELMIVHEGKTRIARFIQPLCQYLNPL